MPISVYLIAALFAGVMVATQYLVNSKLGLMLAHPLQAAFVSFFVGVMTLLPMLFIVGAGLPDLTHLRRVPWYLFFGGVAGAIFVTVTLYTVPRIGVASVVLTMFVAQIITSLLIDHFGLLGLPKIEFQANRAIGAALMIAGLYFINQRALG